MTVTSAFIFAATLAVVIPAMAAQSALPDFTAICGKLGEEAGLSAAKEACEIVSETCVYETNPSMASSRSLLQNIYSPDIIQQLRDNCKNAYSTSCALAALGAAFDTCLDGLYLESVTFVTEECPDFDTAQEIFFENLDACETITPEAGTLIGDLFDTDCKADSLHNSQQSQDFGSDDGRKEFAESMAGRHLVHFKATEGLPIKSVNGDDPCDCDARGCIGTICYPVGGAGCRGAAPSAKIPNSFFRLCTPETVDS